jgi:hypothetical protein
MYMVLLTNSHKVTSKLCVNCKHFIQPKNGVRDEFGKCAKLPFESSKFLVDGIVRDDDFYSCSTARSWDKLCGKNAKEYRKKYTKRSIK